MSMISSDSFSTVTKIKDKKSLKCSTIVWKIWIVYKKRDVISEGEQGADLGTLGGIKFFGSGFQC